MYTPHFLDLFICYGPLGYFHTLVIVIIPAVNMECIYFFKMMDFIAKMHSNIDSNYYLSSLYYVFGTVLSALWVYIHLTLTTTL